MTKCLWTIRRKRTNLLDDRWYDLYRYINMSLGYSVAINILRHLPTESGEHRMFVLCPLALAYPCICAFLVLRSVSQSHNSIDMLIVVRRNDSIDYSRLVPIHCRSCLCPSTETSKKHKFRLSTKCKSMHARNGEESEIVQMRRRSVSKR